ncbi:MAG: hypothetical protein RSB02_07665 [Anaerovoracaceae bacterium]
MKKYICIVLSITLLFICGCNQSSGEKDTALPEAKGEVEYFAHCLLSNGNIVKFYQDSAGMTMTKFQIVDTSSNKVIDDISLEKYQLSPRLTIRTLGAGFYLKDHKYIVFDETGQFVREIEIPTNINETSDCVVSNNAEKLAYTMVTNGEDESIWTFVTVDIDTNKITEVYKLTPITLGKPSFFTNFQFSSDDSKIMFTGITNPTQDVCNECYGQIDLKTMKIDMTVKDDINGTFYGNTIFVFDDCVEINKDSSGKVIKYGGNENSKKIIHTQKPDESQFVRASNDENTFATMSMGKKKNEVEFTIYEKGKLKSSKEFEFPTDDSYQRSTTGSTNFSYSTKSKKIYFDYWTVDDTNPWGLKHFAEIDME